MSMVYPVVTKAFLAAAFPEQYKCPRCLRWHGVKYNTNWPVDSLLPTVAAERQVICDRCSQVLVNQCPEHPVSEAIKANHLWQKTTKPWNNDNNRRH